MVYMDNPWQNGSMLPDALRFFLPIAFTLFVACALSTLTSGLVLWLFKLRRLNQMMQHPYLQHRPWERLPLNARAMILLDYFLRLAFPHKTGWIMKDANRLLAHVSPSDVPGSLKWPLYGLWVGCGVGLIAMLALWVLLLLVPRA